MYSTADSAGFVEARTMAAADIYMFTDHLKIIMVSVVTNLRTAALLNFEHSKNSKGKVQKK